jgi:hypothetical protein
MDDGIAWTVSKSRSKADKLKTLQDTNRLTSARTYTMCVIYSSLTASIWINLGKEYCTYYTQGPGARQFFRSLQRKVNHG